MYEEPLNSQASMKNFMPGSPPRERGNSFGGLVAGSSSGNLAGGIASSNSNNNSSSGSGFGLSLMDPSEVGSFNASGIVLHSAREFGPVGSAVARVGSRDVGDINKDSGGLVIHGNVGGSAGAGTSGSSSSSGSNQNAGRSLMGLHSPSRDKNEGNSPTSSSQQQQQSGGAGLLAPAPSVSSLQGFVKTISYALLQAPSQLLLRPPQELLPPEDPSRESTLANSAEEDEERQPMLPHGGADEENAGRFGADLSITGGYDAIFIPTVELMTIYFSG
jgi:hypothetical protein